MYMTKHARERWKERFSNLNPEYEYSVAKKPKKAELANIKKQCPQHVSIMRRKSLYGLYYKISKSGVVFVISKEGDVITVFPYCNKGGNTYNPSEKTYFKGKAVKKSNFKNKW